MKREKCGDLEIASDCDLGIRCGGGISGGGDACVCDRARVRVRKRERERDTKGHLTQRFGYHGHNDAIALRLQF